MNANPSVRYSNENELKHKLDEIRDSRQTFLKNCSSNILEIDSFYGTNRVQPGQYAKFESTNRQHHGKVYMKTPNSLKEMKYTVMNEMITDTSQNDREWFKMAG